MFLARIPKPRIPAYSMHQLLWSYMPPERRRADDARPFVYRTECDSIVMLSRFRPNCECACLNAEIRTGAVYQFALRCSPVRGTQRINGTVRKRREPYRTNDERREWLRRRLGEGAELLFATVTNRPGLSLRAPGQRQIAWPECEMTGTLQVTDRAALIAAMCRGIGGRGAWGHGLLYLPEVMG